MYLSFVLLVTCSISGIVFATDDWWENGHFYQIYPRSFQDSDGDGIGDLNGITSRLLYLKTLNISGIWLSPIFESPMIDTGYDISDFTKIHHEFGTMADFDRLLKECQKLDIKLILDFVPNHTSDQHKWFKKSADPHDPEHYKYKDYYIWHVGKLLANGTRLPPSNWIGIGGGSMWKWVSSRQAFYLHQFAKEQPDLNFRNKHVIEDMNNVLRFWLKKGVSGFRIDAVPHLIEVEENVDGFYDDEPINEWCKDHPDLDCYLIHNKTQHQTETYDLVYQFRSILDEAEFKESTRILMTEAYGSQTNIIQYYGKIENGHVVKYGSHIPFNFYFMFLPTWADGVTISTMATTWINEIPLGNGIMPNWVMGNHDCARIATRYGPKRADLINILIKTLPGITITYYGEEIGMTNVEKLETIDRRFPARTPFQWDNSINAGFSTNSGTWLPVADNYTINNVEQQKSQPNSHLKIFQQLASLRQNPAFKYGSLKINATNERNVLTYKREIENDPNADVFVIVLNLSNGFVIHDIDIQIIFGDIPEKMEIVISSIDATRLGQMVDTRSLNMGAFEGVVLMGRRSS